MSDGRSRRDFLCLGGALAACALLPVDLRALPRTIVESAGAGAGAERTLPIPPADAVQIDAKTSTILVRSAGKVFAFSLACPHEHAAVRWNQKAQQFQCTKHDSKYKVDGVYVSGRSTRSLDRFPIRRDGANVVITTDVILRADKDPGGWAAALVTV